MQFLTLTLALLAVPASSQVTPIAQPRPRVEVAFVLDTTGSMSGLIDGAKRKIWAIARRIGEGRPRPDLKIALVGYRDKGDAYVTRVHDFTGDMDDVYSHLMSFVADGGGDTPEHVSAALHDAVHRLSWSQGPVLKMIFLVGDAPPHVDYQDGFDYRRHAREARQLGIAIEAIECGGDPEAARYWQEIASLGEGHFARIDASGGMPARVTPVDGELARLNADLAGTVVAGGSARDRAEADRKVASRTAMPAAMAAEAAGYFAGAERLARKDLVDLPEAEQKKEIGALRQGADAPAGIAGKSDAEAVAYLRAKKEKRETLQTRIGELQRQREEYLKKAEGGSGDGFDKQVVDALKTKAATYGIQY